MIRNTLKTQLANFEEGKVFTLSDFNMPRDQWQSLAKAMSEFVLRGELRKISKGKYYKPKKSRFGVLSPDIKELVKDFLVKDGQTVGYISGVSAFAAMGLTTQISGDILIGTNKYKRPIHRGQYKIIFLLQPYKIQQEHIPLMRILDAIRLITKIPATTPDEVIDNLKVIIRELSTNDRENLIVLGLQQRPFVRALLGALLEDIGEYEPRLLDSLNPISTYTISVSSTTLPNKSKWKIQ